MDAEEKPERYPGDIEAETPASEAEEDNLHSLAGSNLQVLYGPFIVGDLPGSKGVPNKPFKKPSLWQSFLSIFSPRHRR